MQQQYPQKQGLDLILKRAFSYWSQTLGLQIMFSIVYSGIFMTGYFFLANKLNIQEQMNSAISENLVGKNPDFDGFLSQVNILATSSDFMYLRYGLLFLFAFLYPLNLGFYQIYKKIDLEEEVGISDLFVGYNGLNFFRYTSYFVFWYLIFDMLKIGIILPFVWVVITLFIAPLMFFQNKTIFEGLALNWKVLRTSFVEIIVCCIVAFIFKYIGFAVFFVGALFTFPFWNAMIYSLYTSLFEDKIQKAS